MEFNLLQAVTDAKEELIKNNIAISNCDVSKDEDGVVTLRFINNKQESVSRFKFDDGLVDVDSVIYHLPDETLGLGKFIRSKNNITFSDEEYLQESISEAIDDCVYITSNKDAKVIYGFVETKKRPFEAYDELKYYLINGGFFLNNVFGYVESLEPIYLVADEDALRIRHFSKTGELTKVDLVENIREGFKETLEKILNRLEVDFSALFRKLTCATDEVVEMTDESQNNLSCLVHMDGKKTTKASLNYFPNQSLVVDIESQLCSDRVVKTFVQSYTRSLVDEDTTSNKLYALIDIFFNQMSSTDVFRDALYAANYEFVKKALETAIEKYNLKSKTVEVVYPEWPECADKVLTIKLDNELNLFVLISRHRFEILVNYGSSLQEYNVYRIATDKKGLADGLDLAVRYFDPKALDELEKKLGFLSRFDHRISLGYPGNEGNFFVEITEYNRIKYLHVIRNRGDREVYRTTFRYDVGETLVQILERYLTSQEVKAFLNKGEING